MKKVIITGATGFLGLALLKELIQNDIFVYALCRKNSGRITRLAGLPNVKVIETDLSGMEKIPELEDCDCFYHLAWEGGRNDFTAQYKNIDITLSCLKLASNCGCKRFICTGSQAEYGNHTDLITEETPLNPTTSYGACKAAAYYLTVDLAKRLNMEYIWARVFSVYGPSDNANTLIISMIKDLSEKGKASLNTDGEHIWNYLYEDDAARALRMLGEINTANTVYNVASSVSKPLREYVEEMKRNFFSNQSISYGTEKSEIHLRVTADKLLGEIGEFERYTFQKGIESIYKNI